MAPASLTVAYMNVKNGCMTATGDYDFRPLRGVLALAELPDTPAIFMWCEAKGFAQRENTGLIKAQNTLSEELGPPYVGLLGRGARGPFGPAIFYDPTVLIQLPLWTGSTAETADDKHNVFHFGARYGQFRFLAIVQHWDPRSGVVRRQEAGVIAHYGRHALPVIVGGDLNATASGPHLPPRDWDKAGYDACAQKAVRVQRPDGCWQWVADTAAVDHLIGRWDDDTVDGCGARVDGSGFHSVAELCYQHTGDATHLLPTVNDGVDPGGGQLIDWLLVNDEMAPRVVRAGDTAYQVHVPATSDAHPFDHRLLSCTIDARTGYSLNGR